MKHEITLILIDRHLGVSKNTRDFEAVIDGVHTKGVVQTLVSFSERATEGVAKITYKFKFNVSGISKHPDYRNIRRELLKLMVANTKVMARGAIR